MDHISIIATTVKSPKDTTRNDLMAILLHLEVALKGLPSPKRHEQEFRSVVSLVTWLRTAYPVVHPRRKSPRIKGKENLLDEDRSSESRLEDALQEMVKRADQDDLIEIQESAKNGDRLGPDNGAYRRTDLADRMVREIAEDGRISQELKERWPTDEVVITGLETRQES